VRTHFFILIDLLLFLELLPYSCDLSGHVGSCGDQEVVFCDDCGGVFKTNTGGACWYQVGSGLPRKAEIQLRSDVSLGGTLWVYTRPRFGSEKSGIYKSTDGGEHWMLKTDGIPDTAQITAFATSSSHPQILYVATLVRAYYPPPEKWIFGFYRSSDEGENWNLMGPGISQDGAVKVITVDPQNPDVVYAATDFPTRTWTFGIYKSTDGGVHWIQKNTGLPLNVPVRQMIIHPGSPQVLYAALDSMGVFKSDNAGENWYPINSGLPISTGSHVSVTSLALDLFNPQLLYAGLWTAVDRSPLYRSSNGGNSWEVVSLGTTLDSLGGGYFRTYEAQVLSVSQFKPEILYLLIRYQQYFTPLTAILKSTDAGKNWKILIKGSFGRYYKPTSLVIDPVNANIVYVGTYNDEGVIYFCPLISAFDGEKYRLEAEAFPAAFGKDAERTSYHILENLVPVEGNRFQVKVSNGMRETDFIDDVTLVVVNHPHDTQVVPDETEGFHLFKEPFTPLTGLNKSGEVFALQKPPGVSRMTLLLQGQNSPLSLSMISPQISSRDADYFTLRIYSWEKNSWQLKGRVFPFGTLGEQKKAITFPVEREATNILLRLDFAQGFWNIKRVSADFSKTQDFSVQEIKPAGAFDNLKLERGEEVEVLFTAESLSTLSKGWKRTYLVKARGFYIPGLEFSE